MVMVLAVTGTMMSCSKPESQVIAVQPTIEKDFLQLLSDLTAIMQAPYDDPMQNVEALRKYIATSGKTAAAVLNKLNQDILDMDPNEREKWRQNAKPILENKLEEYAKAQIALRKRLNDAQKWELSEILAALHY
jgi:hypothetical protein